VEPSSTTDDLGARRRRLPISWENVLMQIALAFMMILGSWSPRRSGGPSRASSARRPMAPVWPT